MAREAQPAVVTVLLTEHQQGLLREVGTDRLDLEPHQLTAVVIDALDHIPILFARTALPPNPGPRGPTSVRVSRYRALVKLQDVIRACDLLNSLGLATLFKGGE